MAWLVELLILELVEPVALRCDRYIMPQHLTEAWDKDDSLRELNKTNRKRSFWKQREDKRGPRKGRYEEVARRLAAKKAASVSHGQRNHETVASVRRRLGKKTNGSPS